MDINKEKIKRLTNAMEKMFIKMNEANNVCLVSNEGLDKRDLSIISFIAEKQAVIMRDIADFLSAPVSTLTGIVDRLVEKKYLNRFYSSQDRRIVKVKLTETGRLAFENYQDTKERMGSIMLAALSEDEQDKLIDLLETISSQIKNNVLMS